jgi:hypothetical protein
MQIPNLGILLNLSIIIPAIAGIYVFKSINKAYRYFIISICVGALHEYSAEFQLTGSFLFQSLYSFISTQFILLLYFNWDAQKIAPIKKSLIHSLVFVLVAIDQYFEFQSAYHIQWAMITSMIGISIYGIRLLTQNQNNFLKNRESLSRKLIIIPYLVFSVYYAAINILMHFLFSKATQPLFMNLYNVIRWINFLSYISYTLALLWAPKKERFL